MEYQLCSKCGGSGTIKCSVCDGGYATHRKKCNCNNGNTIIGKDTYGYYIYGICIYCNGQGYKTEPLPCYSCRSGKVNCTCSNGYIQVQVPAKPIITIVENKVITPVVTKPTCNTCHGNNYVECNCGNRHHTITCTNCNGAKTLANDSQYKQVLCKYCKAVKICLNGCQPSKVAVDAEGHYIASERYNKDFKSHIEDGKYNAKSKWYECFSIFDPCWCCCLCCCSECTTGCDKKYEILNYSQGFMIKEDGIVANCEHKYSNCGSCTNGYITQYIGPTKCCERCSGRGEIDVWCQCDRRCPECGTK